MSNLPMLKFRALDNNGDVIPGAKLNFYEAGTTTPQDTYTDLDRTNASTNPVVANSDGYFALIYLDPTLSYKVVFTDADDVEIYTADNLYATSLGAQDLTLRIRNSGISPTDYDAVGDGVADESNECQSAIDNANQVVDLLGLTYRCDSFLTLASQSNTIIQNGVLDYTNCTNNEYIKAVGSLGDAISLNTDITAGDTTIDASTTGLAVGDVLMVQSTAVWHGGTGNTGELMVITGLSGGIQIACLARDNYTAATSSLYKITPVENLTFKNLTIIGSSSASGNGDFVFLDLCQHVRFENCKFTGIKGAGIRLNTCLDVTISNCFFENGAATSNGVEIAECCEQVVVQNCTFEYSGYGLYIGGIGTRDGVCRDITINDCRIIGSQKNGILISELGQNLAINNNFIDGSAFYCLSIGSVVGCKIIGNKLRNNDSYDAVRIYGIIDDFAIVGNKIERLGTSGAVITFAGTAANNISNITFLGNRVIGGTYGVNASNVEDGTFGRGINTFSGQSSFEMNNVGTNVSVDNFVIDAALDVGTTITAGTNITSTAGNITASAGNISASGTITAGTGITSTTGAIAASAGNINAGLAVYAGTTITAGTHITSTAGNITANTGNISAYGTITAGTNITSTAGNITANAGNISASLAITAGTTVSALTAITAGTTISAGTAITAGTNITSTAGNITASSGYVRADQFYAFPQSQPTGVEGLIYANSSDHHLYFYNGSTWIEIA
jgi:hypothetical protein